MSPLHTSSDCVKFVTGDLHLLETCENGLYIKTETYINIFIVLLLRYWRHHGQLKEGLSATGWHHCCTCDAVGFSALRTSGVTGCNILPSDSRPTARLLVLAAHIVREIFSVHSGSS
jgi:hypothetical protein